MDPFLTYNFRIKWDDRYVAAVTHVSGLRRDAPARPALDIPGQTDYGPVRLERGIITDPAFGTWANMMWSYPEVSELGDSPSMSDFRKDMQIELYDESGEPVQRYDIHNCWPSEFTALPELDSETNAIALASMTLEHEGWERVL